MTMLPYIGASVGVHVAGQLSDRILKRTGSANVARKLPIVGGMLLASTIVIANFVPDESNALVIGIVSLAFFGQGMINLGWTVISDVAPKELIGLTAGIFNFSALFVEDDPVLAHNVRDATAAGLPSIQVSPNQGRLLYLLAKMSGARRVLEIGTLGGYSTTWLARALPAGGQITSLELAFNARLAADPGLESIIIPVLGKKVDGMSISIVR